MIRQIVASDMKTEEVKKIWEHIERTEKDLFDERVVDPAQMFIGYLINPLNMLYYIGDEEKPGGFVIVYNILPGAEASFHLVVWDYAKLKSMIDDMKELVEKLLKEFQLHRLGTQIPNCRDRSVRLAEIVGFETEGVLKESFKHNGQYHDMVLLGLVNKEA